jgi:hypothetical protein
MTRALRLLLVLAHLAAASLPCGAPGAEAFAPETLRAYASGAVHAHGGPPEAADGELRAPCSCGCDETPDGRLVASPLGAALVPAAAAPLLPRAAHAAAPAAHRPSRLGSPADPVPRLV